ncbi:putative bifunctional diguanylate cyclase/phosphodiesterase [Imhoffiella purpurea]|uniref:cyclic-guanylate-specific phosphodiesterase n=1 Tax=Imhoffiella purpurea TaxID=1249627 RepID=W9W0D0_9GAMM|nr:EAL domain-containing protein [Imhoffiella purpurea]EXJ16085.1 diguanylate cyclase [Imhoffiella purpurea]
MSGRRPEFLAHEQMRALYLQAPISNLTVLAISALYFFVLHSRLETSPLLGWTLTMWSVAGYRLWLWSRWKQHAAEASPSAWLRRYRNASLAVGCSWSLVLLMLGDMEDQVVVASLFMLVLGVTSSAVAILSSHLPSFVLYVYPQLFMMALILMTKEPHELRWLALAICIYALMLTLFARNADRLFRDHVHLGTWNQELVARLNAENLRREEVIRERTEALTATNASLQAEIMEREKAETALREQGRSLRHLADHDPLTGLPNRLLMLDRLGHAIHHAHRAGSGVAVLFLDLDHFKEINDSLGHTTGDQLLKAVSGRLLNSLREGDTVARLGGDEFVVIVEDARSVADVTSIAEMILNAFNDPLELDSGDICITPSIGVSLYPEDGADTETLLRNADAAMYRAKADGRRAYRFYTADMTERARERLEIETALRRALAEHELRLVFQPQIDLRSGRLMGAEVLVRWLHPTAGLLLPGRFIAVAESTGQIEQIGGWVLEEACRDLKRWERAGFGGIRLGVNVSGRQVLHGNLVETVQGALERSGCRPESLEIEITEGFLIRGPDTSRSILERIRDMGVGIAIDDFGTGYSSLSYLKQFPISRIKIDRAFVRDISLDVNDQAIVRAIIALGRSLGLKVIAEGVETAEQLALLTECGCNEAQGYLFSEPLTASVFLDYWNRQARPL